MDTPSSIFAIQQEVYILRNLKIIGKFTKFGLKCLHITA